MTTRIRLGFLALVVAGACSTDSTAPIDSNDAAARAANTFAQLADSANRAGGGDVASAYGAIAGILRGGGRVTPIALTIDGVVTTFDATAAVTEIRRSPCTSGAVCPGIYLTPLLQRNLIAWDPANPKRLVQLSSADNADTISAMLYPSLLASYIPMASLVYLDGAGGTYFGTSGTQSVNVANSSVKCVGAADSVNTKLPSTCTEADVTIAFNAKVEPSTFLVANNTATGTHTMTLASSHIAGSYYLLTFPPCDSSCMHGPNTPPLPPDSLPQPPLVVRPSAQLPAKLTATVDSVVHLTLTISNPSAQSVDVAFPSSQKYEFAVSDTVTGREVWRWGANKSFAMMFGTQSIPGGGSLAFTEQWKPTAPGRYLAHGQLVSTSHRAEAYASVVVP